MNQSQLERNTFSELQARENAYEQVGLLAVLLSEVFFFGQSLFFERITFDTQPKITPEQ